MKIYDSIALPTYGAHHKRYERIEYRRCGRSGIRLPLISLGLWHNFGHTDSFINAQKMLRTAFDLGITHFDMANNYGGPFGAAEENFGRILKKDFLPYRDELIISTKAGWDMWPGPYGNFGSRKYLIASCDQSLMRMGLDYVDIFYHHRPDTRTPMEETMGALDHLVRQGKALYVGVSQYDASQTKQASEILKRMGTPMLIHQPRYSMLDRWAEDGLLKVLEEEGIGAIAFSPLEQGLLTDKYLKGFPKEARAVRDARYLKKEQITPELLSKVKKLNKIAKERKQTLAQMAINWLLKDDRVTSILIGASTPEQISENVKGLNKLKFNADELREIESVLNRK
ncbi:MAG TPA: L-glyceraldehyde 3-phosphate reductase [Saprospiraceae bacterium]|nr:L-glyceraldehyde 3-phosphate reductase [Saprospiraceae bacterium]